MTVIDSLLIAVGVTAVIFGVYTYWRRKRAGRLYGNIEPNPALPCIAAGHCPYEYDQNPERDIEGMPFLDGDDRSCPIYGHVCPEFMEDLGLTVEDLNIRAIIHCGGLYGTAVEEDQLDPEAGEALKREYREIVARYPPDKYPRYYSPDGSG